MIRVGEVLKSTSRGGGIGAGPAARAPRQRSNYVEPAAPARASFFQTFHLAMLCPSNPSRCPPPLPVSYWER